MTKPTYRVALELPDVYGYGGGDTYEWLQYAADSGSNYSHVGIAVRHERPFRLADFLMWCRRFGVPDDQLNIGIWDVTDVPDLHLPAHAVYLATPQTILGSNWYYWNLNEFVGLPERDYIIAAYRTGATDLAKYYGIYYASEATAYDKIIRGSSWNLQTGYSVRSQIWYDYVDVVDDVIELTVLPGGKSKTDGKFVEGSCDITLKNKDFRYNVENNEAERYSWINLGDRIRVLVQWDAAWYTLFKGIVERIKPNMAFGDRSFYFELVDEFHRFKEEEIDLGTVSGKTADQIIALVMAQLGFTDYYLDTDPDVLRTLTKNGVNAMSVLESVVSAGQHSHYVDGGGNYRFKNNQWPPAGDPDFVFDLEDPCIFIGEPSVEYDRGNVHNSVNVQYGGSSYTGWKDDANSIAKYLKKTLRFDNEWIPNVGYALGIQDYLLEDGKDPGADLEFTLFNKFPEMLQLVPGSRMQILYAPLGINAIYTALDFEHNVAPAGDHTLKVKARKWVQPPSLSWYDYIPHGIKYYTALDIYPKAQSFQVPTTGDLLEIELNLTGGPGSIWMFDTRPVEIFLADGAEHPTGSVLATSELVYLTGENHYTFSFTGANRITLNSATVYCLKLYLTNGRNLRLKGGTGNPIPGRQYSYYNGGWIDYANTDAWFRIRLKT